ncbi:ATPase [Mycoplasmopsis bovigenitalium]|uniref:ATPase n=1 Tax=Mycoplasmopsis bovigenitalium TaxID=2112 RepID=A0A449A8X0_9BACT|nr:AAA family ATPase [Mycoplasmopsis bovigenitalium]VEU60708.1 ATPase [Mycoplasmopsis bovigenitalium]
MKNLANELRPKTLSQIIGQENNVKLLSKIVENKISTSFIFYGESGTGKTSAACALANEMNLKYALFNASIENKNRLLELLQDNQIIIIDEIHRLTKNVQDVLLSYLEFDKIIIYATTTENPYFRVNPALRSRMQILRFDKLDEKQVYLGIKDVIKNYFPELKINDDNIEKLVKYSSGDYRFCLNNLQMLALLGKDKEINEQLLKTIIPNINFYSDMNGDAHYDNLSAFHKSLRGSDVDASLYYGALILKTGDYQGLFRRITCVAYEDIALADPNIALRVEAALNAVERLGFPEANLPIFYLICYMALSPKSASTYKAMKNVQSYIEQGNVYDVPKILKEAHYSSASKLGNGVGYKWPHDYEGNWINQNYLPKQVNEKFFKPDWNDIDKIVNYYKSIETRKGKK